MPTNSPASARLNRRAFRLSPHFSGCLASLTARRIAPPHEAREVFIAFGLRNPNLLRPVEPRESKLAMSRDGPLGDFFLLCPALFASIAFAVENQQVVVRIRHGDAPEDKGCRAYLRRLAPSVFLRATQTYLREGMIRISDTAQRKSRDARATSYYRRPRRSSGTISAGVLPVMMALARSVACRSGSSNKCA